MCPRGGECAWLLAAWLREAQRQRWRPAQGGLLAADATGGLPSPALPDEEALDFQSALCGLTEGHFTPSREGNPSTAPACHFCPAVRLGNEFIALSSTLCLLNGFLFGSMMIFRNIPGSLLSSAVLNEPKCTPLTSTVKGQTWRRGFPPRAQCTQRARRERAAAGLPGSREGAHGRDSC